MTPLELTLATDPALETYESVAPTEFDTVSRAVRAATIVRLDGVTTKGPMTQTVAVPVRMPLVAVMVVSPATTPVTTPVVGLTVAIAGLALDHAMAAGGVSTSSVTVCPAMMHPAAGRCRRVNGVGG